MNTWLCPCGEKNLMGGSMFWEDGMVETLDDEYLPAWRSVNVEQVENLFVVVYDSVCCEDERYKQHDSWLFEGDDTYGCAECNNCQIDLKGYLKNVIPTEDSDDYEECMEKVRCRPTKGQLDFFGEEVR